jgi:hypothetical protein
MVRRASVDGFGEERYFAPSAIRTPDRPPNTFSHIVSEMIAFVSEDAAVTRRSQPRIGIHYLCAFAT